MYLSAQKKKIRPFEGFSRKAIVCIPSQEELKKRTEDRKKEGIELPENAVSDMKSMLCSLLVTSYPCLILPYNIMVWYNPFTPRIKHQDLVN